MTVTNCHMSHDHVSQKDIFFFLNQQFITRLAVEDRGSYFRNYVQSKQTNMKLKKRKRKKKGKKTKRRKIE